MQKHSQRITNKRSVSHDTKGLWIFTHEYIDTCADDSAYFFSAKPRKKDAALWLVSRRTKQTQLHLRREGEQGEQGASCCSCNRSEWQSILHSEGNKVIHFKDCVRGNKITFFFLCVQHSLHFCYWAFTLPLSLFFLVVVRSLCIVEWLSGRVSGCRAADTFMRCG